MNTAGVAVLAAAIAAVTWTWSLWVRPYGKCRALGCRGGRIAGSDGDAWGYCPKCHGKPVPRPGAAAVARLVGRKHGKRFW